MCSATLSSCTLITKPCFRLLTPRKGMSFAARALSHAGGADPHRAVTAGAPAAGEKGKPKKVSAAVRAMQEAQEARARAEEDARRAEEERRRKVRGSPPCTPVMRCAACTMPPAHMQNHTLVSPRHEPVMMQCPDVQHTLQMYRVTHPLLLWHALSSFCPAQ